jgi:nitrogenase molybdenum-iron protein alpha/beta subunit
MMQLYTTSTYPDSLTGAIFAIEGVADAAVVLNGPTGCKFYHSAISDAQYPRSADYDPLAFADRCYFGQPRVPATYLDGDDYVFGSAYKLDEVLRVVAAKGFKLIVVVNSPGAALIGDDLNRLLAGALDNTLHFAIENTGASGDFGLGFQTAVNRMIDSLALPDLPCCPHSVNFLGINLSQKHFENNYATLCELFGLCGIKVVSALGATDKLDRISRARMAELNVVISPETGLATATKLADIWGKPWLCSNAGQPIGFDATEALVRQVCDALGMNPSAAIEQIGIARAQAYLHLARFSSLLGLPKGATYALRADPSTAYPLVRWLSGYLGMVPVAIELLPGDDWGMRDALDGYLHSIQCQNALLQRIVGTASQLVFADGDTIAACRLAGQAVCGIEINFPSLSYIDVTRKQLYGPEGALWLIEQIINGLRYC